MLAEDFRDGFTLQQARFVNPFLSGNDRRIERILPA
jgi:predicted nucleic acid-binding protein